MSDGLTLLSCTAGQRSGQMKRLQSETHVFQGCTSQVKAKLHADIAKHTSSHVVELAKPQSQRLSS